jgi:hypothetical protein
MKWSRARLTAESDSNQHVKRDVRGACVTGLNRNSRPRKRGLSLGGRSKSPPDREALPGADDRDWTRDVVAVTEESVAFVHVATADDAFRVRDHGPRARAPVEDAPVGRALDRQDVPAVRNLEALDLGRRIGQVDLVVEKLQLPSPPFAPQRDASREVMSVLRGMGEPAGPERETLLSGLVDVERRRRAPRISGEELEAEAPLRAGGRGNEQEGRRQNGGVPETRAPERSPPPACARPRLRRTGLPRDTRAARRRDAATCTAEGARARSAD